MRIPLKLTGFTIALLAVFSFAVAPIALADATTSCTSATACVNQGVGQTCTGTGCTGTTNNSSISGVLKTIINLLSLIVGAVSVIMIIIGGFRYVISAGDSNSTSGAKNTIVFALVGLVIVVLAQIIVQFVLAKTNSAATSTSGSIIIMGSYH